MTILFTLFLHWLTVLSLLFSGAANSIPTEDFIRSFENLNSEPEIIPVTNEIPFNFLGGHLQGIQVYKDHQVFLSGSSENISYMVSAELGDQSSTISIDTLMQSPLRHAGGFQIFNQYLAVGIEDNNKRNLAYLQIYDLESENPWKNPLYSIERKGDFERVTAGAVGITAFRGKIWILVANWDSRVLDFYSCPEDEFYSSKGKLALQKSIIVKNQSTTEWSDPNWLSYQNLNLFADKKDNLYMIGTAKNDDGGQVADLYQLYLETANPKFVKLRSKKFNTSKAVDFKAAAGFSIAASGKLILASAPYQLENNTTINLFTNHLPQSITLETLQEWASPDARQASVATEQYILAINNHSVSKYDRASGSLIASKNYPNTQHLNSGFLFEQVIYCAHSNYPNHPDSSSIRIIDPKTLSMKVAKDLGQTDGSLTWIIRSKDYWYGLFAFYGENNYLTYLARMNDQWGVLDQWTFPEEIIEKMSKMSISGGVKWKDGFLVTGHDEKALYYLTLPESGSILKYIKQFKAPFTGQGIALDPTTEGLVGIKRAEKKVISARFLP
jgi:hypothetical protein